MAKETLCFVKRKNKILMINRSKPPFMGMWNAVGGHLKENESLEECAIREVYEESGLVVKNPLLISEFTWNYDDDLGYVYLFLDEGEDFSGFPKRIDEGIVDFIDIDWILDPKNFGVVEDLRVFIGDIKKGVKRNYHMIYKDSKLVEVVVK